jgi:hypothetical protein
VRVVKAAPALCDGRIGACPTTTRDEVDRVFGEGYAAAHPDVVASVMLSGSLDWAAMHLAAAVRDVAAALVIEESRRSCPEMPFRLRPARHRHRHAGIGGRRCLPSSVSRHAREPISRHVVRV